MFSGIVKHIGIVASLDRQGSNLHIGIRSDLASQLHVDQSVAHNGVCLTVVSLDGDTYVVTAIEETLQKSNLGDLLIGDEVNLECAMRMDGMLDGHIVQGHVDTTAICSEISQRDGSTYFTFEYSAEKPEYTVVDKGSICVNGVSLTVVEPSRTSSDSAKIAKFQVAIIPYTLENTNFHAFKVGSKINLEFDILGKYILRYFELFKDSQYAK